MSMYYTISLKFNIKLKIFTYYTITLKNNLKKSFTLSIKYVSTTYRLLYIRAYLYFSFLNLVVNIDLSLPLYIILLR